MVTEEEMLAGDHQIEGGDGGGSANNNDNSSNITVPIILWQNISAITEVVSPLSPLSCAG